MISDFKHYSQLAKIFKYPSGSAYTEGVNECYAMIRKNYPELAPTFLPFVDYINSHEDYQIEETFNLTFHIQAICFLDLGYVLFGEDYKRGEFLVHMKKEHEKINHDCGCELADNLPNVLELMTLSSDIKFLNELGVRILIPAMEKMTKEFDMARIALRQKMYKKKERVVLDKDDQIGNIYGAPIEVLLRILQKDFEGISFVNNDFVPEYGRNLLTNCGTCSETHTPQTTNSTISQ